MPLKEEFSLVHQVPSLLRNWLLLTVAWLLSGTIALASVEMPSEPSWPELPQLSGDAVSPHSHGDRMAFALAIPG